MYVIANYSNIRKFSNNILQCKNIGIIYYISPKYNKYKK